MASPGRPLATAAAAGEKLESKCGSVKHSPSKGSPGDHKAKNARSVKKDKDAGSSPVQQVDSADSPSHPSTPLFARVSVKADACPDGVKVEKARITSVEGEKLEVVTEGGYKTLKVGLADVSLIDETQFALNSAAGPGSGPSDFSFFFEKDGISPSLPSDTPHAEKSTPSKDRRAGFVPAQSPSGKRPTPAVMRQKPATPQGSKQVKKKAELQEEDKVSGAVAGTPELFARVSVNAEACADGGKVKKARITSVEGEKLEVITEGGYETLNVGMADVSFIDETQFAVNSAPGPGSGPSDFSFFFKKDGILPSLASNTPNEEKSTPSKHRKAGPVPVKGPISKPPTPAAVDKNAFAGRVKKKGKLEEDIGAGSAVGAPELFARVSVNAEACADGLKAKKARITGVDGEKVEVVTEGGETLNVGLADVSMIDESQFTMNCSTDLGSGPSDFSFLFEQGSRGHEEESMPPKECSAHALQGKGPIGEQPAASAVDQKPEPGAQSLKVCGPEFIQTLRGTILGRQVAVICCGEAHERALDLTREKGIIEAKRGWVHLPNSRAPGFDPSDAQKKMSGLTLEEAKTWMERWMSWEEGGLDVDGYHLLYLPAEGSQGPGVAYYYGITEEPRKPRGSIPPNAVMCKWFDLDEDVRADIERQKASCADGSIGKPFRESAHDATIAKRKEQRKGEGYELLDDWLIRQYQATEGNKNSKIHMHFVHEHSVPLSELELHVERGVSATPPAHECLKAMELDSDTDSAEERDPDDGTGGFADYLGRRVEDNFAPDHIHGVDPRNLGNPEDGDKKVALLKTIENFEPCPKDTEELELDKARATFPKEYAKRKGYTADNLPRRVRNRMPSWELFFGQAAEFLYHTGNVKADYAPFVATCLPTPQRVFDFFEELYFGTVPQAVTHLGELDDVARSKTRIRSLALRQGPGKTLQRRPTDSGLTPVKAAPLDRYLKARGSNPPRTWVSELSQRLRAKGGSDWVEALQVWYRKCVVKILSDPKRLDKTGDYFAAYLRETHPDIYKQIDPSDHEELREKKYAPTLDPTLDKRKHYLGNITVPKLSEGLEELKTLNSGEVITSTKRQRVIAKIIVDAFQLRLVDVATILKVALIAARAPVGSRMAIVFYGGSDHTANLTKFFRQQGFSTEGLSRDGLAHCKDREPGESCGLRLPAYLQDFEQLFPVPSVDTEKYWLSVSAEQNHGAPVGHE